MTLTELRDKVKARQGESTDTAFAEVLGISRPEWHNIRTGKRKNLSRNFLCAVITTFPDLTLDVMQFLKDSSK